MGEDIGTRLLLAESSYAFLYIQLTVAGSLEHRSYCEVNEQTTTAIARAGYLIGSMIGVP